VPRPALAMALALALAPAAAWAPLPAAGPTTLEEVLVVVNSHIITRRSFQQMVEQQTAELYRGRMGRDLDEKLKGVREKALQDMIDTFVLLDVAAEREMMSYAPSEADFLAETRKRAQVASDADLERMLKSELGLSLGEFVRQQRQNYVIDALLYQEVHRKVPIEEQEARLYYNEHQAEYRQTARFRVRELVVPKAPGPGAAETMAMVREGLKEGAPFESLAKEHSASPSGALGGDLGWAEKGLLLPVIEAAALALGPGEVSDVIETDKDYIIIQLVALESEGARPFEAVRDQIVAKLQEPKSQNALQLYLQAQRLRANIRYMVPREQIVKGQA